MAQITYKKEIERLESTLVHKEQNWIEISLWADTLKAFVVEDWQNCFKCWTMSHTGELKKIKQLAGKKKNKTRGLNFPKQVDFAAPKTEEVFFPVWEWVA